MHCFLQTYDFDLSVDHSAFLDAAFNGGEKPIFAIFSIWVDEAVMAPGVGIANAAFLDAERSYYEMARRSGAHPATMGYSIGGEMNRHRIVRDALFWEKFGLLAGAVRRGLADAGGARKIITTTFMDDTSRSFHAGARYRPDVDMWGANVYQSDYPGSVLPAFMGVPGGKPLLVSEYGIPYASNLREGTASEMAFIAQALVNQSVAMQDNFELRDKLAEQVTVGGFVFEYSDEWWKSGSVDVHDLGAIRGTNFPLGYWAEEFFGLFSVSRGNRSSNVSGAMELDAVDELQARPAVELLTELWAKGALENEGADYSFCNHTAMEIAAKRDEKLYGPHGIGYLGWLAIVIALGLASVVGVTLVRKKRRRAGYQSIPTSMQ